MTERSIQRLKVTDIIVEDRIREDLGNLAELAASIAKFGLLHPITVDENKRLIAGERRLTAIRDYLHWEEVDVRFWNDLTELEKVTLELEENVIRQQMSWAEEVKAKHKLHLLAQIDAMQKGESWTLEDTAKKLNVSVGNLTDDINLSRALQENPELEKEGNKFSAKKALVAKDKKEQTRETFQQIQQAMQATSATGGPTILATDLLKHGDCLDLLPTLADNSVDIILTDPLWGVDIETAGALEGKVEYNDDEALMKRTLTQAYKEMYRVLKEGNHGWIFFGIQFYQWHVDELVKAGFTVDLLPAVWDKGSHGGSYSPYKLGNEYETILHVWKGEPNKLEKFVGNCFNHPRIKTVSEDKIHTAEKPLSLLLEILEATITPGGNKVLIDPFAGSASSLRAGLSFGLKVWGCELVHENYVDAVVKLQKHIAELGGKE